MAALISWPTPDAGFVLLVVEGLLRLALPVAALVAVVLAVRRAAAAARARPRLPRRCRPAEPEAPAVTAAPDRLPAAWQADEATGAVWLTADDAAQGQPGLSWSDPAATAGAVTSGPWAPPPTTGGGVRRHRPVGGSGSRRCRPRRPRTTTCAEWVPVITERAERTPFAPNVGPLSHEAPVSKPAQYQTRP